MGAACGREAPAATQDITPAAAAPTAQQSTSLAASMPVWPRTHAVRDAAVQTDTPDADAGANKGIDSDAEGYHTCSVATNEMDDGALHEPAPDAPVRFRTTQGPP